MSGSGKPPPPPRLKRTLELVYEVDGVVAARVWQWTENRGRDERVAVAVRSNATSCPTEVLRRVEAAVEAMREPGEAWEFGLLDHA
jgi:PhoPQ-activated pathogenicity-related protein